MTNEVKAKEIYKDNLYDLEVKGIVQDKQEILFMLEKMAKWKDEQWKEKAQTAFCYVHNCIGQCHIRPCELREKFDDIMNGKWPKVEKIKTK